MGKGGLNSMGHEETGRVKQLGEVAHSEDHQRGVDSRVDRRVGMHVRDDGTNWSHAQQLIAVFAH